MTRMTRADSQAQTRALLLASARELFLKDGYNATGIAAVTERAGFSSGAFYSNFPNKGALALAVLQEIQAERTEEVEAILRLRQPEAIASIEAWSEEVLKSGWPLLELEFALAARGDPELVKEEGGRHGRSVDFIAQAIEKLLPEEAAGALPVRKVAEATMNLVVGLAVRRIIDPKVSTALFTDLAQFAGGFLQPESPETGERPLDPDSEKS
ncbi:MAG: TetR/AcrR family transcriptional regulator [Segniliparus sp.]|uniref:TetR/AcrR family transcriptional regulator n=1 Tax=Segniliparus sp. TaxID=2804064 RepID=UPI003F3BAC28